MTIIPFRVSDHRFSSALRSTGSLFINDTAEIVALLLLRWETADFYLIDTRHY